MNLQPQLFAKRRPTVDTEITKWDNSLITEDIFLIFIYYLNIFLESTIHVASESLQWNFIYRYLDDKQRTSYCVE